MRTQKTNPLITVFLLLSIGFAQAQDNKNQALYIHEDKVKPSMLMEYEKVSKEFVEACKKHNLSDVNWITASTRTGRYLTISPIEKMADLDKRPFAPLLEKMGEEAFSDLFKRFDRCYDQHGDFIVFLNNELTYTPEGADANTANEGKNYRKWHFLYVAPQNIQKLKGKLKELKALYQRKGSKEYYNIYHNGFGTMGDYYVAVVAAKNAEDYAKKSAANDALLGEEGKKLFGEMFEYVLKYETEEGEIRPDLSYSPK